MGSDPEAAITGPDPNRVAAMDILRGLALFGILAANIRGFAAPPADYLDTVFAWTAPHDRFVQMFVDTFIQGKFITIFGVLFGAGFASQLTRAEGGGTPFEGRFVRRMAVLAVIGLVHGLMVWFGDVLLVYALTGIMLLPFRKRRDRTLLIWAVLLYLIILLMMGAAVLVSSVSGQPIPSPPPPTAAEERRVIDTYARGTFGEVQSQIRRDALEWNWGYFPVYSLHVLSLFLFGVLAWRRGFFQPRPEWVPGYRMVMAGALFAGVAFNAGATAIRYSRGLGGFDLSPASFAAQALQTFGVPALSLGYMLAAILLARAPERLRAFGAVGRMALTNYLMQSVIGALIFLSYGFGLFGRVGAAALLALTVIIFGLQVVFSAWWLRKFRFGPVEWVWRSITYAKRQPFLRSPDRPATDSQIAGP